MADPIPLPGRSGNGDLAEHHARLRLVWKNGRPIGWRRPVRNLVVVISNLMLCCSIAFKWDFTAAIWPTCRAIFQTNVIVLWCSARSHCRLHLAEVIGSAIALNLLFASL